MSDTFSGNPPSEREPVGAIHHLRRLTGGEGDLNFGGAALSYAAALLEERATPVIEAVVAATPALGAPGEDVHSPRRSDIVKGFAPALMNELWHEIGIDFEALINRVYAAYFADGYVTVDLPISVEA